MINYTHNVHWIELGCAFSADISRQMLNETKKHFQKYQLYSNFTAKIIIALSSERKALICFIEK